MLVKRGVSPLIVFIRRLYHGSVCLSEKKGGWVVFRRFLGEESLLCVGVGLVVVGL